jgi:hypothetical protein
MLLEWRGKVGARRNPAISQSIHCNAKRRKI